MRFCFLRSSHVRFRFLRYQFSPWIVLAIAPFDLLCSSGVNRTTAKIRCLKAMSKIDFAGVYEFINDLLW